MPAFCHFLQHTGMRSTMHCWISAALTLLGFLCLNSVHAEALGVFESHDPYRDAMHALAEGRIYDARVALDVLVANAPGSPGALLDLATLRCSLGDVAEAARLFDEIESRFSPPIAIKEIIHQQRTLGCKGRQVQSRMLIRLARGFDSNANQGPSDPNFSIGSGSNRTDMLLLPSFRATSDRFTVLAAEYATDISLAGLGVAMVQFRSRQNDKLSEMDSASLLAGTAGNWRLGTWQLKGIVAMGATTLGGRPYLNQGQIQLEVEPSFALPKGWQFVIASGGTYLFYPSYQRYNASVIELRSTLRFQNENSGWQASAGALFDHEVNQRPGGGRQGYFTSLEGRFRIWQGVVGELGAQRQQWLADDVYSPGLIGSRRNQNTQVLRAGTTISIAPNQSLTAEYLYTNNRENISIFQYRQRQLQIGWQYQFGK